MSIKVKKIRKTRLSRRSDGIKPSAPSKKATVKKQPKKKK